MTLKAGDKVRFAKEVRERINTPRTYGMRGVVLAVYGRTAEVDCQGTFDTPDLPGAPSSTIRVIPLKNLEKQT